jgi:hypothetical protein
LKRVGVAALVAVLGLTGVASAQTATSGLYGTAEYLMWWTKDSPAAVPLVTDDVLGPGTRVLLGGDDVGLGGRNGARFTVGYSLNPEWAVEAAGFLLSTGTESRSVAGSGLSGSPSFDGPPGKPLVGEARPRFRFEGSNFWAHGLSAGVAVEF